MTVDYLVHELKMIASSLESTLFNKNIVIKYCLRQDKHYIYLRLTFFLGMQGFPILAAEPNGLPLEHKILPEYLQDMGYRTHAIGKWHLGYFRNNYTPLERGFESHLGYYTGYTGYYDYMAQVRVSQYLIHNTHLVMYYLLGNILHETEYQPDVVRVII